MASEATIAIIDADLVRFMRRLSPVDTSMLNT